MSVDVPATSLVDRSLRRRAAMVTSASALTWALSVSVLNPLLDGQGSLEYAVQNWPWMILPLVGVVLGLCIVVAAVGAGRRRPARTAAGWGLAAAAAGWAWVSASNIDQCSVYFDCGGLVGLAGYTNYFVGATLSAALLVVATRIQGKEHR